MPNFFNTPYNCGSLVTETCKNAKVPMTEEGFLKLLSEAASSGTYIIDYSIEKLKNHENILAFIKFLRMTFISSWFLNLWFVLSMMNSASIDVGLDKVFESYVNYAYSYVCTCTEDVKNM